jgi:hypothetical protein
LTLFLHDHPYPLSFGPHNLYGDGIGIRDRARKVVEVSDQKGRAGYHPCVFMFGVLAGKSDGFRLCGSCD